MNKRAYLEGYMHKEAFFRTPRFKALAKFLQRFATGKRKQYEFVKTLPRAGKHVKRINQISKNLRTLENSIQDPLRAAVYDRAKTPRVQLLEHLRRFFTRQNKHNAWW